MTTEPDVAQREGTDHHGTVRPGTDHHGTDHHGTDHHGTDHHGTVRPGTDHHGTDHQVSEDTDGEAGGQGGVDLLAGNSRIWVVTSIVVGAALVTWFFVVWLALGREPADAAGESIGTAFGLMLIASVVGAIRNRKH